MEVKEVTGIGCLGLPDWWAEVRCWPETGIAGPWRETDKASVHEAAKWVQRQTWDEVKQGCL